MDDRNAMSLPCDLREWIFFGTNSMKRTNVTGKKKPNHQGTKVTANNKQTHSFVCFVLFLICSWDSFFFLILFFFQV